MGQIILKNIYDENIENKAIVNGKGKYVMLTKIDMFTFSISDSGL